MPPRKQNGGRDKDEAIDDLTRVSVDRVEYAALLALRDAHDSRIVDEEKAKARLHDLSTTCRAQARRLAEVDLTVQLLEHVNGLQRVFIDLLRTDAVASLEDLSMFWRTWFLTTDNLVKQDPKQRDEVNRLEPDLFRSWRIWVRDAGRVSRTFAVAGTTRAEVDGDRLMLSQAALQDRIFEQQRAHSTALAARVRELEAEVEAYRNAHKTKQPG